MGTDKRLTLAAINKALADVPAGEILVKGKDYFYFTDGNAHAWPTCSVYVARLSDLSLTDWIGEWRNLHNDYLRFLAEL